jgi:hypothetical protein
MSMSKIVLIACGLAGVLATSAARAEEIRDVEERHAMFLDTAGKMHMITLNTAGHDMVMKNGRELPAGALVYRAGGKFYVVENKKMTDGKMMFDSLQSWTSDRLLTGHN